MSLNSCDYIQLFRERLSEINVYATISNGNMGYDQYSVPDDCSCRSFFCCFPLALTNKCPWPLVLFFQISLKNSIQNHPQTIPIGIGACTFSHNLSRNSCIYTPECIYTCCCPTCEKTCFSDKFSFRQVPCSNLSIKKIMHEYCLQFP